MLVEPQQLNLDGFSESDAWFELRKSVWVTKLCFAQLLKYQADYVGLISKQAEMIELGVDLETTKLPSKFNSCQSKFVHQCAIFTSVAFSRLWGSSTEEVFIKLRGLYTGDKKPNGFWGYEERTSLECLIRAGGDLNELFVQFVDHSSDKNFHAVCEEAELIDDKRQALSLILDHVRNAFSNPEYFSFAAKELVNWFPRCTTSLGDVYRIVNGEILASYGIDANSGSFEDGTEVPSSKVENGLASIDPDGREATVLVAMHELKLATPADRLPQQAILDKALGSSAAANDHRRVFKKLKDLELIAKGENNRGFYLTEDGKQAAEVLGRARSAP